MFRDKLGHLEHADLLLAAEDLLEAFVRIDYSAVLAVLQLVLLDVVPELLGHLSAWHRLRPDHVGERFARRQRLHKCGARLPFLSGHLLLQRKCWNRTGKNRRNSTTGGALPFPLRNGGGRERFLSLCRASAS